MTRSNSTALATALATLLAASVACAREPSPAPPGAQSAATPAPTPLATSPVAAPVPTLQETPREPDPFFSGFHPEGKWQVAIDGKVSEKGQIWVAERAGRALLFDLPELPELVLLQPARNSVEAFPRDAWLSALDGTAALAAEVAPRSLGALEINGEQIAMSYDGRKLELRAAPDQLGTKTLAELLASNAYYRFASARYRPSEPILRNLGAISKPVEVKVFFGTWCPACTEVLPKVFTIAQGLEGSQMRFAFHGLPRIEGFGGDPEAKKYSVRGVPTAVLLVDGKEVGRVDGGSWRIPELGIQNTLLNAGVK